MFCLIYFVYLEICFRCLAVCFWERSYFYCFLVFERGDVAVLLFICLIGCEFVFVFVGDCLLFSKGESLVILLFSSGESFVFVCVVFFFFSCFGGESIGLLLLFRVE